MPIEQYGYLLELLNAIEDGDQTLLDSSKILFGSGLRDGMRHSPNDLPIVLGGSGNGKLRSGQNIRYEERTPLSNLYYTMLTALDIDVEGFGDISRELCDPLV